MINFQSAAFLFLAYFTPSLSLRIPLSTLSFIPHKYMWCGALLMRTEWTDPRPQCHWGPPPQIHHRYQFSSIPFKRPQCGIPNTLLYYPIANSSKSFYYASPFFICPPWKSFKCFFWKESVVKLLTIPCLLLSLYRGSHYWHSAWCFSSTWCKRAFVYPSAALTNLQLTADLFKITAGNHGTSWKYY